MFLLSSQFGLVFRNENMWKIHLFNLFILIFVASLGKVESGVMLFPFYHLQSPKAKPERNSHEHDLNLRSEFFQGILSLLWRKPRAKSTFQKDPDVATPKAKSDELNIFRIIWENLSSNPLNQFYEHKCQKTWNKYCCCSSVKSFCIFFSWNSKKNMTTTISRIFHASQNLSRGVLPENLRRGPYAVVERTYRAKPLSSVIKYKSQIQITAKCYFFVP